MAALVPASAFSFADRHQILLQAGAATLRAPPNDF
jgi:hypothetical protein